MHCGSKEATYGCLFCRSGKENSIAAEIERRFPEVDAIAPMKTRYYRRQGACTEEQVVLFPGYVFFRCRRDFNPYCLLIYDDIYRVLEASEKEWQLSAADVGIVQKIFDAGGTVGLSEAYFEGERIRIADGFLKEYEGQIVRVNRRAKTAQINIRLHSKTMLLWLGYEEIERAEHKPIDEG